MRYAQVHNGRWRGRDRTWSAAVAVCLLVVGLWLPSLAGAQAPGALDEYQPRPPGVDPSAIGGDGVGGGGAPTGVEGDSTSRTAASAAGSRAQGAGRDAGEDGIDAETATQASGPVLPLSDYPVTGPVLILALVVAGLLATRLGLSGYRRLQKGR